MLKIIKRRVSDEIVLSLISNILKNGQVRNNIGMPLGNLTSQFFANVYLHELDFFVKHKLGVKYYIRYVDDFVILHENKKQLEIWKHKIEEFLIFNLKIELHPQKSRVISLSKGVDFVGFRNFYHFRLLRKRNIIKMLLNAKRFKAGLIDKEKFLEIFQGWRAYAKWANSYNLKKKLVQELVSEIINKTLYLVQHSRHNFSLGMPMASSMSSAVA